MSGDRGDDRAGTHARRKCKVGDIGVAQSRNVRRRRQPRANGGVADRVDCKSTPVVGNLDADPAALRRRDRDGQPAAARLSGRLANRRSLDAVVDRVAHHVDQRVLDELEHFAVDLELRADDVPVDLFARLAAQIAHHARKGVENTRCRHHPDLPHFVVEVVDGRLQAAVGPQDRGELPRVHFKGVHVVAQIVGDARPEVIELSAIVRARRTCSTEASFGLSSASVRVTTLSSRPTSTRIVSAVDGATRPVRRRPSGGAGAGAQTARASAAAAIRCELFGRQAFRR